MTQSNTKQGGCAVVGIVMGSSSDYETMKAAEDIIKDAGVPYEIQVVSAHRTTDLLFEYGKGASDRGLRVIIAGAGGAAHLPGMLSALTVVPVLGVPVLSSALHGVDSLLSIVQMPKGIPTATFAIGKAGAANAGLFALQILALSPGYEHLSPYLANDRAKRKQEAVDGNKVFKLEQ